MGVRTPHTPSIHFFSMSRTREVEQILGKWGEGRGGAVVGYKVAYSYKNGMVGNRNQKAGKGSD